MAGQDRDHDPRPDVARYRRRRIVSESGETQQPDATESNAQPMLEQHAQYVETVIQQAMRRGDFDNLPGAGKPLEGLGQTHDPDWWIKRKIQTENLTGLGPPALTLRTEDAGLDDRLDSITSENAVRTTIDDFNRRVVDAQRQLHGGPPVVTPVRDVDGEVARWHQRREDRSRARREEQARKAASVAEANPARRWGRRRRRS